MNQTVLAGVGNVYRAEILFRHGVHRYLGGRHLDPVVGLDLWEDLVRLCDTPIARAVLAGPNLFWCPHCQPEPAESQRGSGTALSGP